MSSYWRGFPLRRAARWIAGGSALAAAAGIVFSRTLSAPQYELLYRGGVTAAHCARIDEREVCGFSYSLAIGNTGKQTQQRVRIAWPLDLQRWHVKTHVADIVASARKTVRPEIQSAFELGKTVYTVGGLMPNTLVRFSLGCSVCTRAELRAMQQVRPSVVARGEVLKSDPRRSALRRGVVNLLRVLGLIG